MKKKWTRTVAAAMAGFLALIMLASLAACGKTLKGTYSAEVFGTGVEMTFEGKNVTITLKALGMEVGSSTGTYKIEEDWRVGDVISGTYDAEQGKKAYNGNI